MGNPIQYFQPPTGTIIWLTKLWMFSPAQLASCLNANYVADSSHLPKLFVLTKKSYQS